MTKKLITNKIVKIVKNKNYIVSSTVVGSFNSSPGLSGISDIDIVIIVDELSEKKFREIISEFEQIQCSEFQLNNYNVLVNSTFGPLKFNTKNNIVFHVMIYDINGHIKHVEESPFTCSSWEKNLPIYGLSLKEVYPVLNLQISDILSSRRGLSSYLNDIKKGVITYRKYLFKNDSFQIIKEKFILDERHKLEYSFHITYHLLNNLYKIITLDTKDVEIKILADFFIKIDYDLNQDMLFFNNLYNWKKNNDEAPSNVMCKTSNFLNKIFQLVEKINLNSVLISFYRHQRTNLNNGTFLGSKRDPGIIQMDEIKTLKDYYYGYSSLLRRSKETLKKFEFKHLIESSLINEIDYGDAEGLSLTELSRQNPNIIKLWKKGLDPSFPNGENQKDVLKRIKKFMNIVTDKKANSIIVTHLVVLRLILYNYINLELKEVFKINIDHLENFDFFVYDDFIIPHINSSLKSKIRKQLAS